MKLRHCHGRHARKITLNRGLCAAARPPACTWAIAQSPPCAPRRHAETACSSERGARTHAANGAAGGHRRLRPTNRTMRHRPRQPEEAVQTPVGYGGLGQVPLDELAELAQMYSRLDEEEQAEFQAEVDGSELAMRAEEVMGMDPEQLQQRLASVSKFGSLPFWERTLLQPLALDAIREKLPPEDAELLGKLMVRNPATGDVGAGLAGQHAMGRRFLKLKLSERRRLPGLLTRMQELGEQYEAMGQWRDYMDNKVAIRKMRRADQKGLSLGDSQDDDMEEDLAQQVEADNQASSSGSSNRGGDGSGSSRSGGDGSGSSNTSSRASWGQSFLKGRQRQRNVGAAGRASQQQEQPATAAAGRGGRVEEIANMMTSVSARYATGDGWREEQVNGSEDLQRLKRLLSKLVTLAGLGKAVVSQDGGEPEADAVSQRQYAEELREAMKEVELVLVTGPESEDPVVVDSVEFARCHLMARDEHGVGALQCNVQTMSRWAEFVRASEVRQAYRPFVLGFMGQQDSMSVSAVNDLTAMAEGLSQPRWWLKDDAGNAAAEEEAGDEPQQQHLGWDVVDHEQIAALACGDPLELRCLGELLGSGYSEEALIKWSLHPDIGPKLRSGEWSFAQADSSEPMPDVVRQAMQQATRRQVEGVDFSYSRPRPKRR